MFGRLRLVPVAALLACTAAPVDAPAQDDPPAALAAAPQVDPPAPVAVPRRWWCLCYFSDELAPETACLEGQAKCDARVLDVARGAASTLAESLTHPCAMVVAERPEDAYGGAWTAAPAGGWRSGGACRLPGPGLRSGRQAAAETRLYDESLGPVTWTMDGAEAIARFGTPRRVGRVALPDVGDGAYMQRWRFARHGLELRVVTSNGDPTVLGMAITAPSTLATNQGIRIGSTRAEVLAAYGDVLDEDKLAGTAACAVTICQRLGGAGGIVGAPTTGVLR